MQVSISYEVLDGEHAKGFDAPDLKEILANGAVVSDGDSIAKEYPLI
ncbi:MAG: hypothetical protein R2777_04770 [Chitinophagales bacterium]